MSNKKAKRGRQAITHLEPVKVTKETPGVSIQLIPEDEIEGPEGFFSSGNDPADQKADREMIAEILRRSNAGDIWAWFSAKVAVSFDGLTGVDYLGACSYADEAEFTAPGGYYDDMVSAALDDLNKQIAARDHHATCGHCQAVSAGKLPHPVSA